jgi:GNAT superfamily N-acetyltransferase
LVSAEISLAASLVEAEWGHTYAQRFITEATDLLHRAFSSPFGAFDSLGSIRGVGIIVKGDIDYALWGIAWLVVSPSHRGLGIGEALIRAMTRYATDNQREFPSPYAVIQLTTRVPEYFLRLGFVEAAKWGDGGSSRLMILDTRNAKGVGHETH